MEWKTLRPDDDHTRIVPEHADDFRALLPIGNRDTKAGKRTNDGTVFRTFSAGINTSRDVWAYCFDEEQLADKAGQCIEAYNSEVDRWKRVGRPKDIDSFVDSDETKIKWSEGLKNTLARDVYAEFNKAKIRNALYRPFIKRFVFFDSVMNERRYVLPRIFPTPATERENVVICVPGRGNRKSFGCFMTNQIIAYDFSFEKAQCFPFYVYNEDGTNRRENITDWSLKQFQDHYQNPSITK